VLGFDVFGEVGDLVAGRGLGLAAGRARVVGGRDADPAAAGVLAAGVEADAGFGPVTDRGLRRPVRRGTAAPFAGRDRAGVVDA
jgi:hypothetical protein